MLGYLRTFIPIYFVLLGFLSYFYWELNLIYFFTSNIIALCLYFFFYKDVNKYLKVNLELLKIIFFSKQPNFKDRILGLIGSAIINFLSFIVGFLFFLIFISYIFAFFISRF